MMHQVRIEFLRVQTFLCAVPRLQDMIGANVLLGEAIRVDLPKLAMEINRESYLPFSDVTFLPTSDGEDPLHRVADRQDRDNPRAQYERGILARDGGHFIAVFPDKNITINFQQQAEALLIRKLPGLRFEIFIEPFGQREESLRRAQNQTIL